MSTKTKNIKWFGMKLTPQQKKKIQQLADRRGVTQKQAVMDLVNEAMEEEPYKPEPGSITASLAGSLELPKKYNDMTYKEIKQQILMEKHGR